MSIQELEETLIVVGDEDVVGIKESTETMYDGTVLRFIQDRNSGEPFACFIDCPTFEEHVYCHRTYLNGLQEGDQVRFAAELKGSVGEGPNQTNYSDRSSVRIRSKFRNFR